MYCKTEVSACTWNGLETTDSYVIYVVDDKQSVGSGEHSYASSLVTVEHLTLYHVKVFGVLHITHNKHTMH